MSDPHEAPLAPLPPRLRRTLLLVATLLLFAGVPTFVWASETDEKFAWTIDPPLTAAFMGAGYWASAVLAFLASRARTWADARIAVPSAVVFSLLTLLATVLHFGRFHEDRPITWGWIGIYTIVPVLLVVFTALQLREGGSDPPLRAPLPAWARIVAAAQALGLLVLGAGLVVAPETFDGAWPWQLTPLTGRVVGAWLVGLGLGAAHALYERDWSRVLPATAMSLVFGVLQLVNLTRFGDTPDWDAPQTWLYVAANGVLIGFGAVGVAAARTAHRRSRAAGP